MRVLAITLSIAFIAACGGKDDPADDSGVPTGGATGTTTGDAFTPPEPSALKTGNVDGVVYDSTGATFSGVEIRFCDVQNCKYATTEANGSFSFTEVMVGTYDDNGDLVPSANSLEAVPESSGPPMATAYVPVSVGDGETRSVDLYIHPLDGTLPIPGSATEVEMGTGLHVTISSGDIEPPLFVDPTADVGGVLLPMGSWVPMDGITGTVAAQWFMHPFDHHATSASGLPVRINGASAGLTGGPYTMYVGSYEDFAWIEVGSFADGDADGWYEFDTGPGSLTGLPVVSTVALVAP